MIHQNRCYHVHSLHVADFLVDFSVVGESAVESIFIVLSLKKLTLRLGPF